MTKMETKYISMEAAIERLCNIYCGCSPEECAFKILQDGAVGCTVVRALKDTPSADVWPALRAYWEEVDILTHKCSHCENEAHLDEFGEELLTEYCPECGAKMWHDEN